MQLEQSLALVASGSICVNVREFHFELCLHEFIREKTKVK